jgi:hypothetical protein
MKTGSPIREQIILGILSYSSITIDPSGLPRIPDLLRYQVIAVLQYSFTPDALYLLHPRQLQNLGFKSFIHLDGVRPLLQFFLRIHGLSNEP